MEFQPDCYLCAIRQALSVARLAHDDPSIQERCLEETCRVLAGNKDGMTPPEIGELFYHRVYEITGNPDPFREQKISQNRGAAELLPFLHDKVKNADDPLEMAVRVAIAGNIVDPGAQESFNLEKTVMEAIHEDEGLDGYSRFKEAVEQAESILYLADNCGEIVFDRVLIETISMSSNARIVVATRDVPIINDVTPVEAGDVGLPELCEVISSGSRMPGTILKRTTPRFREYFHNSDMVISKGQGNWETLEGSRREIFFLFQVKCSVVSDITGCPQGTPMLTH